MMNRECPFSELEMKVMLEHFHDYMTIGGMPEVVNSFVRNGNFSGTQVCSSRRLTMKRRKICNFSLISHIPPQALPERSTILEGLGDIGAAIGMIEEYLGE